MSAIVDIETVGVDPAELSEDTRLDIMKDHGDPNAADGNGLDMLALNPWHSFVAVASIWDTDKGGVCLVITDEPEQEIAPGFQLMSCENEAEFVKAFWAIVGARSQVVSWNGLEFDQPFMVARAMVHGVRVPTWLLDAKPWESRHIDLCDRLRLGRFRAHLSAACEAMEIESPKGGMHGSEVGAAWAAGRRLDVARYCCGDVRALAHVFARWCVSTGAAPPKMTPPEDHPPARIDDLATLLAGMADPMDPAAPCDARQ